MEILGCWAGVLEHIHILDRHFCSFPLLSSTSSTSHKCLCFVQPPAAFANFSWARGGHFTNPEGARVQMCLLLYVRLTLERAPGPSLACFKLGSGQILAQEMFSLVDQTLEQTLEQPWKRLHSVPGPGWAQILIETCLSITSSFWKAAAHKCLGGNIIESMQNDSAFPSDYFILNCWGILII